MWSNREIIKVFQIKAAEKKCGIIFVHQRVNERSLIISLPSPSPFSTGGLVPATQCTQIPHSASTVLDEKTNEYAFSPADLLGTCM